MKIPYRQAVDAVLVLSPEYRLSGKELTLVLLFIASLGEDLLDLEQCKDTPCLTYKQTLQCTDEGYVSRLFGNLAEKNVISTELSHDKKLRKSSRFLHPDFAEAILKHA